MKKIMSIILTIALVLCCMGTVTADDGKIIISVWSFTNELQGLLEKYYIPTHPELEFVFQIYPTDGNVYETKLDMVLNSPTQAVGPEAPDIFAVEAAFVKKYTNSKASGNLKDVGFTDTELNKVFPVVAQIAQDTKGNQKGLSWQSTPGVMMYRASLAEKYLGVKTPEEMQEKVKDWDTFLKTAEELKRNSEGACKMVTGNGDLWNVYQYGRTHGWVVDDKLVVDGELYKYEELCKTMEEDDLTQKAGSWGETWFAGMRGEIETLIYFLPTWGLNYTLKPNCVEGWDAENPDSEENIKNAVENGTYGDWRLTLGPVSYSWGGTWIETNAAKIAIADDPKKAAIKDIINFLSLDTDFLVQYAVDTGDFVGTAAAVEQILANGGTPNPFLGGQDAYAVFATAAALANGSLMTEYDDTLNYLWEIFVTVPYSKGEKDLDTCLAEFMDAVETQLDIKPSEDNRELTEGFVERGYEMILGRHSDADGLKYWTDLLLQRRISGGEMILQFVNSEEFQNKHLSYEDQVEILYNTMLNRSSDPDGKAYWVSMLMGGNPLAAIINGFCVSDEFVGICEQYGIVAGSVEVGPMKDPAPVVDMTKIRAFVTRNYQVILGREPDADGLNYWAQRLASGEATAAEIINGFVNSDEFRNRNLSHGDQVEVLYQVMLDRRSDAAGKAYWVSMLNGGNSLAAVINGFCNSAEFTGICADYGITPGSVDVGELKPPKEVPVVDMEKIRAFVTRCYQIILSRQPEQGGLNYWSEKLASGEQTAAEIINNFVNSEEFRNKHLSNGDSVEVLYQVMLNRSSDADGRAYWVSKLDNGEPFAVVINGFCGSDEFRGICAEYGITPGSVAVAAGITYAEPETDEEMIQHAEEIPATTPEQENENTENIRAFVTHCYRSALFREPNTEEIDYYTEKILSGQMTAKDVARAFTFSQEFQSKWTDSTAFVRVLYRLCLDREADADGLVYWTDKLANGETAAAVFNALTENKEFVQVCATYGVPAGVDTNAIRAQEEAAAAAETEENAAPAVPGSEFTNEEKIRAFVSRFYRDAMGREADEEGLNYYTGRILNGEATPKDVAGEIILSEEFRGRMPGNEELVRILYRVYLGREADEEGLANWAGQLDSGVAIETILNGFAGSEEFAAVVNGLK